MAQPCQDPMEMEMAPLPASFLARLQPAGAFLSAARGAQSPTALAQRPGGLEAPAMAPLKASLARSQPKADDGSVAMSFMSAMRRGLDALQASDSGDDDDDDDDDEGAYYQPAYSQYHAPTASFTGRSSALLSADDDELIFPMEF